MLIFAIDLGPDVALIEPVALHQTPNAFDSPVYVFFIERCSQFQTGGVRQLSFARRQTDFAAYLDRAHEPLLYRPEHEHNAIWRRLPADFDILILSGLVESLDSIADIALTQRCAGLKRHQAGEVRACHGLQRRLEAHCLNRTAFVLPGYRKLFTMQCEESGNQEPAEEATHYQGPARHRRKKCKPAT